MAYDTATILTNDEQGDGSHILSVRFLGPGVRSVERNFTVQREGASLDGVRRWAKAQVTSLNSATNVGKDLTLRPGQSFDLTPETPSQAEIDRKQWLADARRAERITALQAAGVIPAVQADVTALKADILTRFRAAYLADV